MADELLFEIGELVIAIMENRGCQSGVRVPCSKHLHEICGSARTTRRGDTGPVDSGTRNPRSPAASW